MARTRDSQVSTIIFATIFLATVFVQVKSKSFNSVIYWITIITATTVGTTLADFADRSLGIGYAGDSSVLLDFIIISILVVRRNQSRVFSPQFYSQEKE